MGGEIRKDGQHRHDDADDVAVRDRDLCTTYVVRDMQARGAQSERERADVGGPGRIAGWDKCEAARSPCIRLAPRLTECVRGEPVIAGGPSLQKVPQHQADEPGDGNVPRPTLRAGMGAESSRAQTKAGDASSDDGQAPYPRAAWGACV